VKDLRHLLWSSIDNETSRDLDQLEYAEKSGHTDIRLLVAVADVDAFVKQRSALDQYAYTNATSVYAGITTFHMLPEELSTDFSSLLPNRDRLAVVVDFKVAESGEITEQSIYRALVRNHAKLTYPVVGAWLESNGQESGGFSSNELETQLRLQYQASTRLLQVRQRAGALSFDNSDPQIVIEDGKVVDLVEERKNAARDLIESLMVSTNAVIAQFLHTHNIPWIARMVQRPHKWYRIVEIARQFGEDLPPEPDGPALAAFLAERRLADPAGFRDLSTSIIKAMGSGEYEVIEPGELEAGHFGLAVPHYTHSTAPNRRYIDLVIQRLVKSVLQDQPQYSVEELQQVDDHCTQREREARRVQRQMRKIVAARLLSDNIGEVFEATVTGASQKATYIRLIGVPTEGRLLDPGSFDVGDKLKVRLVEVDADRGFIDFLPAIDQK
jgi:exoribonuclease-2